MALSALAPAFERSRKTVVRKSTQAVLRLVPELRPVPGEQASDLREVATLSTSETLAERAISLGMVPSGTPQFVDISIANEMANKEANKEANKP